MFTTEGYKSSKITELITIEGWQLWPSVVDFILLAKASVEGARSAMLKSFNTCLKRVKRVTRTYILWCFPQFWSFGPPRIFPLINLKPSCFFRYVLGYKGNAKQQCVQSRGHRASGIKVVHVVTAACSTLQLQSLLNDRLLPLCPSGDTEIQVSTTWTVAGTQSEHQQNLLPALNLMFSYNGMLFIVYFIVGSG